VKLTGQFALLPCFCFTN